MTPGGGTRSSCGRSNRRRRTGPPPPPLLPAFPPMSAKGQPTILSFLPNIMHLKFSNLGEVAPCQLDTAWRSGQGHRSAHACHLHEVSHAHVSFHSRTCNGPQVFCRLGIVVHLSCSGRNLRTGSQPRHTGDMDERMSAGQQTGCMRMLCSVRSGRRQLVSCSLRKGHPRALDPAPHDATPQISSSASRSAFISCCCSGMFPQPSTV